MTLRAATLTARRTEEACLNGWPGLRHIVHGGLLLRFSDGYTRRANSANAIGPLAREPEAMIRFCENAYRSQGLPSLFRLSSAWDQGLGPALDRAGYAPPEDETLVLVRDLDGVPNHGSIAAPRPDDAWLDALARIQGQGGPARDTHRKILEALTLPAGFITVRIDDVIVSLCFAAVHDGIACVNSVATDPRYRRRGLAGRAIEAALAWARHQAGATSACVPVVAANEPAVALYRSLGFAHEGLRYHYRRRPNP